MFWVYNCISQSLLETKFHPPLPMCWRTDTCVPRALAAQVQTPVKINKPGVLPSDFKSSMKIQKIQKRKDNLKFISNFPI